MLDLFVFMLGILIFAAVSLVLLHFERKGRCGYCQGGSNPDSICQDCWNRMEERAYTEEPDDDRDTLAVEYCKKHRSYWEQGFGYCPDCEEEI